MSSFPAIFFTQWYINQKKKNKKYPNLNPLIIFIVITLLIIGVSLTKNAIQKDQTLANQNNNSVTKNTTLKSKLLNLSFYPPADFNTDYFTRFNGDMETFVFEKEYKMWVEISKDAGPCSNSTNDGFTNKQLTLQNGTILYFYSSDHDGRDGLTTISARSKIQRDNQSFCFTAGMENYNGKAGGNMKPETEVIFDNILKTAKFN